MKHAKGWMLGETERDGRGGMHVAWDRGEPVEYTSLPNPRVLHVSHLPDGAKLASSLRDRSRRRGRRDEAAPAPAAAPVAVAGDRRRSRGYRGYGLGEMDARDAMKDAYPSAKNIRVSWDPWAEAYMISATVRNKRVSAQFYDGSLIRAHRDWPGDRAGHRRAARKGWAKKRRVSRAAKLLARRRKRR